MTSRTREIFDFAQNEPEARDEIEALIQHCDEDEIGNIEAAAKTILAAIGSLTEIDEDDAGFSVL